MSLWGVRFREPWYFKQRVSYTRDFETLLALVYFLGRSPHGAYRTPTQLARDVSMHRVKIIKVLKAYPGIFREQVIQTEGEEVTYSLQARYATHKWVNDKTTTNKEERVPTQDMTLILNHIVKSSERETVVSNARRAAAVTAIGFIVVIVVAAMKH